MPDKTNENTTKSQPHPSPPRERGGSKAEEKRVNEFHHWRTPLPLWIKLKSFVREMRTEQTAAEKIMWEMIRKEQILGYKFRRQHPIDRFIVDFYNSDLKLIIEIDGGIHNYLIEEDEIRQGFLEILGFNFIRFSNEDVFEKPKLVIELLKKKIIELSDTED
jgi:very-short-patch-repair endonuclease